MISGRTIICIASNWEVDPTSKHHIMEQLSGNNTVIWVSYHGTRRPRLTRSDARGAVSAVRRMLRGPVHVAKRFVHVTPLVIPGVEGGAGASINHRLVTAQVRRVLRRVHRGESRPVQLWTFAPDVAFLAGKFNEECVVYYCVDEHSEFEGVDRDAIRAAERRLMGVADVVFTTSAALQESRSAMHPNVHLARHGVDVRHFSRALDGGLDRPADVPRSAGPVIGFFGLLHHWVDTQLIARVADLMPNASFVLIGDPQVDTSELRARRNVHLLGRKPYATLPAYCAAFDVGILPFQCTELTRHVNPIKLREYLAAGLPVVSTPLREAYAYEPEVVIADDAESFARACERAARENTRDARLRRRALVAGETWKGVAERVSAVVMRSVERQSASRPAHAATARRLVSASVAGS